MSDLHSAFPSSFELWEFVLAFEDGSMPPEALNDRTLAIVAIWYLYLLPPADAMARVEEGVRRNHLRLRRAPGAANVELETPSEVWPVVLRHVLESFGEPNPLAAANRLMDSTSPRSRESRAA